MNHSHTGVNTSLVDCTQAGIAHILLFTVKHRNLTALFTECVSLNLRVLSKGVRKSLIGSLLNCTCRK